MKIAVIAVFVALYTPIPAARADHPAKAIHPSCNPGLRRHRTSLMRVPLSFEKNFGQAERQVEFLARSDQYKFLVSASKVRIVRQDSPSTQELEIAYIEKSSTVGIGANQLPGVVNYFTSSDSRYWHTQIPRYRTLRFPQLYPKVDLIYHGDVEHLEFDFVLGVGAHPEQIRMRVTGAKKITIAGDDLVLQSRTGEFRLKRPQAYQVILGKHVAVSAQWKVAADVASFVVADYDRSRELVIDPVVSYVHLTSGLTRTLVDSADSVYIAAPTPSAAVEIKKTTANGTLVYDTLLGSSNDSLHLGTVDSNGNAYVIGLAAGSFPVVNPIPNASKGPICSGQFDKVFSCGDAAVVKLDTTGSIVFSTLLGGSLGEAINAIATDQTGKLYVTGITASGDFPTLNAFQAKASGTVGAAPCGGTSSTACQLDAFVGTIDPAKSSLVFSTYLGGTDTDVASGIATDDAGNAYVTGFTQSIDFPLLHATHSDGRGFVAKFNASGTLIFSTYLGQTYEGSAVGVDPSGNVLIAGDENPGWNGFLRRLNPDGTELSTWLIQSLIPTNFSGNPLHVTGMAIDRQGDAYLTGYTEAYDLPIVNAVQAQNGGELDAFVTEFSPTGAILFSTYLGGSSVDQALSVAVDSSNAIYVAGQSGSPDFPLLDESAVTATGSGGGFVVKIDIGSSQPLIATPNKVAFSPQSNNTTTTQTVTLTNTTLTSITVASVALEPGVFSPEFAVTNGCGTQIPPGGNCNLQVSYTPQFPEQSVGTLRIVSSVGRVRLGITGESLQQSPLAALIPQTADGFAVPGQTVPEGLIRIVNLGIDPLMVTGIATSSDFKTMSGCAASLPSLAICTVHLTFSPTKTGVISGSVTINSNDPSGPQTLNLDGFGEDFSVSSAQSSASVAAGTSATYPVSVSSNVTSPGPAVTIALSCSGLPVGTACNFKNSQLVVGSASVDTTLTITTSAPTAASRKGARLICASVCLVGACLWLLIGGPTNLRRTGLICLFLTTIGFCGCNSSNQQSPPISTRTPAGTYTIVVNGTAGSLQHSTNLALTVQ